MHKELIFCCVAAKLPVSCQIKYDKEIRMQTKPGLHAGTIAVHFKVLCIKLKE